MKNLTPWSNLYSIELKHKITLKSSHYKVFCYGVTIFLLLAFITYSYSTNLYPVASLTFVTVLFLSLINFSLKDVKQKITAKEQQEVFTVTQQGRCQFYRSNEDAQEWQLSAHSRVSFLGCWLIFNKQENKPAHVEPIFIFKDQLSTVDYSRLRRIIKALKPLP